MYRIYIVEDDKGIAEGIGACLKDWGMETRCAADFCRVVDEFEEYRPHLVLLDVKLPFMDGYHWCREIRRVSDVPILFISSVADNMNIVMAMNMGGDDFVSKPFDQGVLVAKVQALLRRAYDFRQNDMLVRAAGAVLNTDDNTLSYEGKKIELSRNEYRILLMLMKNKNKVVSREKLMETLWETDCYVDENTLTVNVARLRKTLAAAGLVNLIKTKYGSGYMLEAEE